MTAYVCLLFNNLFIPMIVLSRFEDWSGNTHIPCVWLTSWLPGVNHVVH